MDAYLTFGNRTFRMERIDVHTYLNPNLVGLERTWTIDVYNPAQKAGDRADDEGGNVFSLQHVPIPGARGRQDLAEATFALSYEQLNKYGNLLSLGWLTGTAQAATLHVRMERGQLSVSGSGLVEVAGRTLPFEFAGPASYAEHTAPIMAEAERAALRPELRAIVLALASRTAEGDMANPPQAPGAQIRRWGDAYLPHVRWFVEAFSAAQLAALGRLDTQLSQIYAEIGVPLPGAPEIYAARPWQRIMQTARAALDLLDERHDAHQGEAL